MIIFQKCSKVFKSSEMQLGSRAKETEEFLNQFQSSNTETKEEENAELKKTKFIDL